MYCGVTKYKRVILLYFLILWMKGRKKYELQNCYSAGYHWCRERVSA